MLLRKLLLFATRRNLRALLQRKILVPLSLIFLLILFLHTDLSPDLWFLYWGKFENISCHYEKSESSAIPVLEDDFEPSASSIFFIETSCRGDLNPRQACSIESAARAHEDWQVHVFFVAPVLPKVISFLDSNLPNFKPWKLNLLEFAKYTPLEDMVTGGALNRTRWRVSHTSDVLRYLTLYKWSGIYLDMDMVVARNFKSLVRNFAAREDTEHVSAGIVGFSKDELGRRIAVAAVRDIMENYRGDTWGQNGPGVITRVARRMCGSRRVEKISAATCNGFEVYGPEYFYPIRWQDAKMYFESSDLEIQNSAYGYHVWNYHTRKYVAQNNSFYSKLARRFCPTTYGRYRKDFG